MEDLESDLIVDRVLNRTACELYYRYGNLLAPITVALTIAKYCQFGHRCPKNIEEDGLERQQCDSAVGDNHADGAAGENQADGASTCFEGDGPQPAV